MVTATKTLTSSSACNLVQGRTAWNMLKCTVGKGMLVSSHCSESNACDTEKGCLEWWVGWDFAQGRYLGGFFPQEPAVQGISAVHKHQQSWGPAGVHSWAGHLFMHVERLQHEGQHGAAVEGVCSAVRLIPLAWLCESLF